MKEYDAVIVGAGPAGGQCARDLAKAGKSVLLIDKSRDFSVNNYSSGGAPIEMMQAFDLPEEMVGTFWNKLAISSSHDRHVWQSAKPAGVILDFTKLRAFLADETTKYGCDVKLGCAYKKHERVDGKTLVHLSTQETVEAKVLIDGTGCERKVLEQGKYDKTHALIVTGMEYLVSVTPEQYQPFANTLSFLLGLKWMPQGYAWVFPMGSNQLKIGVIRYFPNQVFVPHEKQIGFYLDQLLNEHLDLKTAKILDKHGKTLTYTYYQNDRHYENNVVAIGDAVSMLNPLASEGIRHAMFSGQMAAKHTLNYLHGKTPDFQGYTSDMRRYCGNKWRRCEMIMKQVYRESDDAKFDLILRTFKKFSMEEMIDLAFHYKLGKVMKFCSHYFLSSGFHKLKRISKAA